MGWLLPCLCCGTWEAGDCYLPQGDGALQHELGIEVQAALLQALHAHPSTGKAVRTSICSSVMRHVCSVVVVFSHVG